MTLAGLLAAVIVAAALATPALYPPALALGFVDEEADFLRIFRRLLMVGGLAVLFIHFTPWREGNAASYGLRASGRGLHDAARAIAVTFAVMLAVLAAYTWAGVLNIRDEARLSAVPLLLGKYLVPALLIGGIEELMFRGWMLRRLRRSLGPVLAASSGAAIYAALHAFRLGNPSPVPHDWRGCLSGFVQWMSFATNIEQFGPAFTGLFLFGIVLTILTWRYDSILPAIGVHASSALIIHTYSRLTWRGPDLAWAGGKSLYDGAPVWLLLILAVIVLSPRPSAVPRTAVDTGQS